MTQFKAVQFKMNNGDVHEYNEKVADSFAKYIDEQQELPDMISLTNGKDETLILMRSSISHIKFIYAEVSE